MRRRNTKNAPLVLRLLPCLCMRRPQIVSTSVKATRRVTSCRLQVVSAAQEDVKMYPSSLEYGKRYRLVFRQWGAVKKRTEADRHLDVENKLFVTLLMCQIVLNLR
ncbi:unnamed protein product [Pieris macdunnoughi]|uniref:Uncharacterized protein n=1 Tax=Pieris macdunnoughi TaxID=345717 RepID=A0A821SZ19_9NEOP|nr:unnamed protein product [Pieris macdunnoughi]